MADRPHAGVPGRRGFTLIELLVVISIIALLIGILLPVLSSARQAGRDAQCLSNLRQIGVGVYGYSFEYDGILPISYFDGSGDSAQQADWALQIAAYMINDGTTNYGEGGQDLYSPGLQCPSALIDAGRLHYSSNLMLMPFFISNAFAGNLNPYSMDAMKRPTELLLVADGGQVDTTAYGQYVGDAYAALDRLDNYGANDTADYFDPTAADNDDPIDPGFNLDGNITPGNGDLRWRHAGDGLANGSDGGAVNVLFADGHAEARRRAGVLKRNVRADVP
ncbi:MAG: DUF1559 domain-containing protein [Planctomycetota bacterium]